MKSLVLAPFDKLVVSLVSLSNHEPRPTLALPRRGGNCQKTLRYSLGVWRMSMLSITTCCRGTSLAPVVAREMASTTS